MDNITHSLTGALAAKLANRTAEKGADQQSLDRTVFWLTVVSANLPDIDILLNFFGDSMFAIQHHRGLTHSLLFAPLFAFIPAAAAYALSRVKNMKLLWGMSLIGILLHILFDLITPFGTQILAPVFTNRFSLDWMFIIDPFFTGTLGLILYLGRRFSRWRRAFALSGVLFVIFYLLLEMVSHTVALNRTLDEVHNQGIPLTTVSVLPQPLSPFRWMSLAQTDDSVYQAYYSVLERPAEWSWKRWEQASDFFVHRALATNEGKWYMTFARHPLVVSTQQSDDVLVEIHDMQFSFNPELMRTLGFAERQPPFVLRFVFSPEAELLHTSFNR